MSHKASKSPILSASAVDLCVEATTFRKVPLLRSADDEERTMTKMIVQERAALTRVTSSTGSGWAVKHAFPTTSARRCLVSFLARCLYRSDFDSQHKGANGFNDGIHEMLYVRKK